MVIITGCNTKFLVLYGKFSSSRTSKVKYEIYKMITRTLLIFLYWQSSSGRHDGEEKQQIDCIENFSIHCSESFELRSSMGCLYPSLYFGSINISFQNYYIMYDVLILSTALSMCTTRRFVRRKCSDQPIDRQRTMWITVVSVAQLYENFALASHRND